MSYETFLIGRTNARSDTKKRYSAFDFSGEGNPTNVSEDEMPPTTKVRSTRVVKEIQQMHPKTKCHRRQKCDLRDPIAAAITVYNHLLNRQQHQPAEGNQHESAQASAITQVPHKIITELWSKVW